MKKGKKTYIFRVVIEQDRDAWSAYCPELLKQGAATWGHTRQEALRNINEVIHMVIEELIEDGQPIPASIKTSSQSLVAVSL